MPPDAHPEVFDRHRSAWQPIGCFLLHTGDRVVLIDAGLGPEIREMPHGMRLVGGQLLTGLWALGVSSAAVTDVVCSHFHSDHVGWLFDLDADPIFPRAAIWFGGADWQHFVTGPAAMRDHIRAGFQAPAHAGRMRPVDRDTTIAPGVTAVPAPGHTPGHLCVSFGDQPGTVDGEHR